MSIAIAITTMITTTHSFTTTTTTTRSNSCHITKTWPSAWTIPS
jgi:hypothetical protein